MRRLTLIACAALLSGCVILSPPPSLEQRSNPRLEIKDGRITLSQEVLYFRSDERNVPITWRLPEGSKLRFPPNGIVIEGAITDRVIRGDQQRAQAVALDPSQTEIVECRVARDGLSFTCLNRNSKPGVYKYTIRVRDGDRVIERDPAVVNGSW